MTGPAVLIEPFETPITLDLRFIDVPIRVLTNDGDISAALRRYYAPYVVDTPSPSGATVVHVVQGRVLPSGRFVVVQRPGAKRPKEAVQDLDGGRLIQKTVTGVIMGLWPGHAFAAGDVRPHLNQVVNLINACYAKAVLARGHLMLHASAVSHKERAAVLAGPPGAGKSTAALHLVEQGLRFVSNDRVLAKPLPTEVEVLGYPKQPRVNPGTLLHHSRLSALLAAEERASLATLSPAALRDLERKSDVDLDAIYGPGTVELRGRFETLVLLEWSFDGDGFHARRLKTAEVLPSLHLIHKDLGVFDLDRPGLEPSTVLPIPRYVELLTRIPVIEVRGKVDFGALADLVHDLLR